MERDSLLCEHMTGEESYMSSGTGFVCEWLHSVFVYISHSVSVLSRKTDYTCEDNTWELETGLPDVLGPLEKFFRDVSVKFLPCQFPCGLKIQHWSLSNPFHFLPSTFLSVSLLFCRTGKGKHCQFFRIGTLDVVHVFVPASRLLRSRKAANMLKWHMGRQLQVVETLG